jgi:hypothetical protein
VNNRPSPLSMVMFVGSVALISALLWLVILGNISGGNQTKTPRVEMLLELSKVLAQVVLVTVLGATVSFLYNQYAKVREEHQLRIQKKEEQRKLQLEEDNKLRRELLASLITVRAQVERTRREFRLLPAGERQAGYRPAIEKLLDARLRLSQVWHDTETWKQLYPQHSGRIQEGLAGMKVFLDGLIEEYETCGEDILSADPKSAARSIAGLLCFGTFVTGNGGRLYTVKFLARNYRRVARIIRRHIVAPPDSE